MRSQNGLLCCRGWGWKTRTWSGSVQPWLYEVQKHAIFCAVSCNTVYNFIVQYILAKLLWFIVCDICGAIKWNLWQIGDLMIMCNYHIVSNVGFADDHCTGFLPPLKSLKSLSGPGLSLRAWQRTESRSHTVPAPPSAGRLIINFSLPNEITPLPTNIHSLSTFSIFAQTPLIFAQTPPIFAQPSTLARPPAAPWISGSWNTPVQMEGDRRFFYNFCLSLATENATDGR